MQLQASLHSHVDEITDLDISKCNKYLATASMNGQIIIWDWKKCLKVDVISDHTAAINNLKFFTLHAKDIESSADKATKEEEIQILVSCSEDGTIRIFDVVDYLEQQQSIATQSARRSRSR